VIRLVDNAHFFPFCGKAGSLKHLSQRRHVTPLFSPLPLPSVYLQALVFVPFVDRINEQGEIGFQDGTQVSERSVKPEQWGTFLITIFDEWVRRDVAPSL
jgi:hypothetical protein